MTVFSISQSIFYSKKLSKLSDEKRTFLFSLVPPFPISKQNAQQATPHTFPPPPFLQATPMLLNSESG